MKLGYSTWGMPKVSIVEAIKYLSQLGYDGIEITVLPGYTTELRRLNKGSIARIKRLLRQHQLKLTALSAHTNLVADDRRIHASNVAQLRTAIDLAVELAQETDRPVVNTTSGRSPHSWSDVRDKAVSSIRDVVEYATARNVVIALEPHVGAVVDTPQKMLEVLQRVKSSALKVNFDVSHFDVMGFPLDKTIAVLAPYIIHTHVKDQRGTVPNYQFLIPGEGDFDYTTYLKTMQKHGYDGFITVEISVVVQRRRTYDPFTAAAASYRTLSNAFQKANISR